ncbi:MAG: sulfotransferase [Micropepsaceae bacterium]
MLARPLRHPSGETALNYALAKEREDLGDDTGALAALMRGASRRRAMMSYRVQDDVATMRDIAAAFDETYVAGTAADPAPGGPVFVLGLPRSGTTLVDRILSSHSAVASLGEINDMALAMTRGAGPAGSKADLVRRAAAADAAAIGADYIARTRAYGVDAPFLIDKTPLNFLYIGLIARALPTARIVHLSRHPMDSCFGMFKTLFRMGYPFSYDFGDLAAYYAAYDRLMAHWRRILPGRLIEMRYEEIVDNQERETRRLVAACGLDWQDACLDFHNNAAPVSTASAAQVRRPIYREALGRWRRLGRGLDPLRNALIAEGVSEEALA